MEHYLEANDAPEVSQAKIPTQSVAIPSQAPNAAYETHDPLEGFQADICWPCRGRRFPQGDLNVEIIGAKMRALSNPLCLDIYLNVIATNQKAIKAYLRVPEATQVLKTDMERLGISFPDMWTLMQELKKLANKPVHAHVYSKPRSPRQDLCFISASPFVPAPAKDASVRTIEKVDFGF